MMASVVAVDPGPDDLEGSDMGLQTLALIVSLAVNTATLVVFVLQTRFLAKQTSTLNKSLEYAAYQKLVDYLNEVNMLLLQDPRVATIFKEMDFIQETLDTHAGLSIEKIGLAWLIINRYEAALVGHELGVIPDKEWAIWTRRLGQDLQIPFIRDVWMHDISNFDYTDSFKNLMSGLLQPTRRPG